MRRLRGEIDTLAFIAGLAVALYGVYRLDPTAALIFGGAALCALAILAGKPGRP